MNNYAELRATLDDGSFDFDQRAYMNDVRAMLAERDALREALEAMMEYAGQPITHPAARHARAALAQEQEQS